MGAAEISDCLARIYRAIVRSLGMQPVGIVVFPSETTSSGRPHHGSVTALQHAANRPIAHHVIDSLIGAGVERIIAVVPGPHMLSVNASLTEYRRNGSVPVHFVEQHDDEDLLRVLNRLEPLLGEAGCVIHVANGLLGEPLRPLIDQMRGSPADVHLLLHEGASEYERLSHELSLDLAVAGQNGGLDHGSLGLAGFCLLSHAAVTRIIRAGAADYPVSAFGTLAAHAVAINQSSATGVVETWRRYGGRPADLLELNRIVLDALELRPTAGFARNGDNVIEGRVHIDETAHITGSVIVGPAIIGPGARIEDAFIGSYTAVGGGAHIQGVEVERSIILPGASVVHLGGRLASSIVGREARVFRDFSLPRAMRLVVGDGDEVALC